MKIFVAVISVKYRNEPQKLSEKAANVVIDLLRFLANFPDRAADVSVVDDKIVEKYVPWNL